MATNTSSKTSPDKKSSARTRPKSRSRSDTKAAAEALADEGMFEAEEGLDTIAAARGAVQDAAANIGAAASDLTRARDVEIVAGRLTRLSEVVGAAGVTDIAEGAELLATSDDVEDMSAIVGLMSLGDLERGLELWRLAGELSTISDVIDQLQMPILSVVLNDRGNALRRIAVDAILRAAATRSLSQALAATGRHIGEMGAEEAEEGMVRLVASDVAQQRAEELAAAGAELELRGVAEAAVAQEAAAAARELVVEGAGELAEGSAEIGAASEMAKRK